MPLVRFLESAQNDTCSTKLTRAPGSICTNHVSWPSQLDLKGKPQLLGGNPFYSNPVQTLSPKREPQGGFKSTELANPDLHHSCQAKHVSLRVPSQHGSKQKHIWGGGGGQIPIWIPNIILPRPRTFTSCLPEAHLIRALCGFAPAPAAPAPVLTRFSAWLAQPKPSHGEQKGRSSVCLILKGHL